MNPVFGAVGLLWNGNWQICQAAVDTVLKGGQLRPRSPSSCLPANLSSSAPYTPAFATSGNLPIPMVGRVDDPTQMTVPLSPNASTDNSFDRHAMNLGIEVPAAKGLELKERATNGRRNNDYSNGWRGEAVLGRNVDPFSTWQKDTKQCDSWNHLHMNAETQRDGFGQEVLCESKQRGVQFEGPVNAAPRRVRARMEASSVPPLGFGERVFEELPVPADGGEQLELDLTLKVKGMKGDKLVGTKRLSSPCDSVNSEGSVTSLDTTLREPSKLPSWAVEITHTPPRSRKLLPLLQ